MESGEWAVVIHDDISLGWVRHSGLDPESSILLDSRWSLPRTGYGAGMTSSGMISVAVDNFLSPYSTFYLPDTNLWYRFEAS